MKYEEKDTLGYLVVIYGHTKKHKCTTLILIL